MYGPIMGAYRCMFGTLNPAACATAMDSTALRRISFRYGSHSSDGRFACLSFVKNSALFAKMLLYVRAQWLFP